MKKYLLPILLVGAYATAQNKPHSNMLKDTHKYLYVNQKEFDNTQGDDTETWNYKQVFDIQNKRVKRLEDYNVNQTDGTLILTGYTAIEYPSDNVMITEEKGKKDDGSFIPISRKTYTYNAEGNIQTILEEDYNTDANEYEKMTIYTFEHDAQGKMTSIIEQDFANEDEDTDGNIIHVERDLYKYLYKYDSAGRLVEHLALNIEAGEEVLEDRRTYRYNDKGEPLGYLWEKINAAGNATKYFEQEVKMVDGNATQVRDYDYKNGKKVPAFAFASSFDENILSDEVFTFKDVDDYIRSYEHDWYKNKNAKYSERNLSFDSHPTVNRFKREKSFTNDYEAITEYLGVYDIAKNQEVVKLYPNPTTNSFSINTKADKVKVEVYDLTGKLVKSFAKKQEKYDVSSLNTGVYQVVIKSDNAKQSIKLIKK